MCAVLRVGLSRAHVGSQVGSLGLFWESVWDSGKFSRPNLRWAHVGSQVGSRGAGSASRVVAGALAAADRAGVVAFQPANIFLQSNYDDFVFRKARKNVGTGWSCDPFSNVARCG